MEIQIIGWVVATIAGAILYRMGGASGYNTKFRDLGVPAICFVLLLTYKHPLNMLGWAMVLISFGLFFAALTTYWDFIFDGKDNFFAHGFMCGGAMLPLIFIGVSFWMIMLRAVILAAGMGLVNKYCQKWQIPHSDIVEECFRGGALALTMLMLIL